MAAKTKVVYRNRYVSKPKRRSSSMTVPVAALAGFIPALSSTANYVKNGGWGHGFNHFIGIMTGFQPEIRAFNWRDMSLGLFPAVAGILVHKFIGGRLGVNRMLSRANIPVIRL